MVGVSVGLRSLGGPSVVRLPAVGRKARYLVLPDPIRSRKHDLASYLPLVENLGEGGIFPRPIVAWGLRMMEIFSPLVPSPVTVLRRLRGGGVMANYFRSWLGSLRRICGLLPIAGGPVWERGFGVGVGVAACVRGKSNSAVVPVSASKHYMANLEARTEHVLSVERPVAVEILHDDYNVAAAAAAAVVVVVVVDNAVAADTAAVDNSAVDTDAYSSPPASSPRPAADAKRRVHPSSHRNSYVPV